MIPKEFNLSQGSILSVDGDRIILDAFPNEMSVIDQRVTDILPPFDMPSQIQGASLDTDGPSWLAAVLLPQRRLVVELTSVPHRAVISLSGQEVGPTTMGVIVREDALKGIMLSAAGYHSCSFENGELTRSNFGRSAQFHCVLTSD